MRSFITLLGIALGIVVLAILNLSVAYLLPYPLNKLNIIFAIVIVLIMVRGVGVMVWVTFFSHFLIELYTVTPFGVTLFAATIAVLLSFWLYETVVTNRSWYAALALSVCAITLYRLLYLGTLSFSRLFSSDVNIPFGRILPLYGWEVFFTTILVCIGYAALSPFAKKMDPHTLRF